MSTIKKLHVDRTTEFARLKQLKDTLSECCASDNVRRTRLLFITDRDVLTATSKEYTGYQGISARHTLENFCKVNNVEIIVRDIRDTVTDTSSRTLRIDGTCTVIVDFRSDLQLFDSAIKEYIKWVTHVPNSRVKWIIA